MDENTWGSRMGMSSSAANTTRPSPTHKAPATPMNPVAAPAKANEAAMPNVVARLITALPCWY